MINTPDETTFESSHEQAKYISELYSQIMQKVRALGGFQQHSREHLQTLEDKEGFSQIDLRTRGRRLPNGQAHMLPADVDKIYNGH